MSDSKDLLTGLNPDDSPIDGEYFDPLTGEVVSSDFIESLRLARANKSQSSSQEAPVYTFYINGISTTSEDYDRTIPLIDNLLKEAGINSKVNQKTYNKSGKPRKINFDLAQSIIQGVTPGSDREGNKFTRSVIKKIEHLDKKERRSAKQECEERPKPKFLIVAHSQGNFFAEDVFNGLDDNIKKRTKILAISPFTNYRGINFDNFDYLLRKDDFPNRLKKTPGIAIPKNKSNLPQWPGKPIASKFPGDINSHNIENYLDTNKYRQGNSKDKLVEESFKDAVEKIKELLKPDSGSYKPDCEPYIKIKGPKTIEAFKNGTFTVSWYNPEKNASAVQISGFQGLTIGAEMVSIPEDKLERGSFQFQAHNTDFFGSYDSEATFDASLLTSPSFFWGTRVMESDPDATVKLLGAGEGLGNIPAQAVPVEQNGELWVKWL